MWSGRSGLAVAFNGMCATVHRTWRLAPAFVPLVPVPVPVLQLVKHTRRECTAGQGRRHGHRAQPQQYGAVRAQERAPRVQRGLSPPVFRVPGLRPRPVPHPLHDGA
jgi:hypothetical protein